MSVKILQFLPGTCGIIGQRAPGRKENLNARAYGEETMTFDFEEELKKFHPSLEVEDVEDTVGNQDVTDLADVLVSLVKESKEEE